MKNYKMINRFIDENSKLCYILIFFILFFFPYNLYSEKEIEKRPIKDKVSENRWSYSLNISGSKGDNVSGYSYQLLQNYIYSNNLRLVFGLSGYRYSYQKENYENVLITGNFSKKGKFSFSTIDFGINYIFSFNLLNINPYIYSIVGFSEGIRKISGGIGILYKHNNNDIHISIEPRVLFINEYFINIKSNEIPISLGFTYYFN